MTTEQLQQAMSSLQAANAVRLGRAAFRRRVYSMTTQDGAHYLADILDTHAAGDDSDALAGLASAPVLYAVCSIRGYREKRAERLILSAGVTRKYSRSAPNSTNNAGLRVRDLTANEASGLADVLRRANPRRLDAGSEPVA